MVGANVGQKGIKEHKMMKIDLLWLRQDTERTRESKGRGQERWSIDPLSFRKKGIFQLTVDLRTGP